MSKAILALTSTFALQTLARTGLHSENLYGESLAKCDRTAYFKSHPEHNDRQYPVTGYYRNNECTASAADAGAHFVCVQMPNGTTASGETYSMFWTETGQAASPEQAVSWPKPGPWCICMWAFARMFSQHPDFIDMLQCEATNQWVIENYRLNSPSEASALHAICNKCGVAGGAVASDILRKKCLAAHQQFGTSPTVRQLAEPVTEPVSVSNESTSCNSDTCKSVIID